MARLGSGAALVVSGWLLGGAGMSEARSALERDLAAGLRAGAPAVDVIRFLDERRIEHSAVLQADRSIRAILRDASGGGLVSGAVTVVFRFDEDDRLRDWTVADSFTGP